MSRQNNCRDMCIMVILYTSFTNPRISIQKRNVHISVLNGALWDMEQVQSWICEIGLLDYNFSCGGQHDVL